MNELILKYIDNEFDGIDSAELKVPISESATCAQLVKAFKSFLHALGYSQETIERYIDVESIYNDIFS